MFCFVWCFLIFMNSSQHVLNISGQLACFQSTQKSDVSSMAGYVWQSKPFALLVTLTRASVHT